NISRFAMRDTPFTSIVLSLARIPSSREYRQEYKSPSSPTGNRFRAERLDTSRVRLSVIGRERSATDFWSPAHDLACNRPIHTSLHWKRVWNLEPSGT
ncbi:hypothetical protein AVEN_13371-1, partial [Araneus ventricosus]